MARLMDGRHVAEELYNEYSSKIEPGTLSLSIILVGNNESSIAYINQKQKACDRFGIKTSIHKFDEDIEENIIIQLIRTLNDDASMTGILVQLPLPKKFDTRKILDMIDYSKDVDGLSSYWMGKNFINDKRIVSCTPKGIIRLMDYYKIKVKIKKICIVGTSDLVGKPLGMLLLNEGATITYTNINTPDISEFTKESDIVISATGVPNLITEKMVKDDAIVIDVGFSRVDGKIHGDVDFENVSKKASMITPVPGGVGPMTVAMLIENLIILGEGL